MSENTLSNAWFKLYFGDVPVSFTVNVNEPLTQQAIDNVKASLALALASGFTVAAPGLNTGEKVEEIGYVVRKSKADGTPFINFYPAADNLVRRVVGYYLDIDKPERTTDFEKYTGLKLSSLPVYPGKDHLEKDGSATTKQYMIPLPRPVKIVIEDNPDYDADSAKRDGKPSKEPKYLFVRYVTGGNNDFANTFPRTVNSVTIKFDDKKAMFFDFGDKMYTRNPLVITAAGVEIPKEAKHGDVLKFMHPYHVVKSTDQGSAIRVDELQKAG